jgi:hypothetical protein
MQGRRVEFLGNDFLICLTNGGQKVIEATIEQKPAKLAA